MSENEVVEGTIVDALSDDAKRPVMPADAPTLWPYLKLPFRQRARFFSVYRKLQNAQADLSSRQKKRGRPSTEALMEQAEQMYELYALMDDLMEIAAVDKDDYKTWVETHDDEDFAGLFVAYAESSQPGEASGSVS